MLSLNWTVFKATHRNTFAWVAVILCTWPILRPWVTGVRIARPSPEDDKVGYINYIIQWAMEHEAGERTLGRCLTGEAKGLLTGRDAEMGAYSGPKRAPIPEETGHPFRSKAATHSGVKPATF